MNNYEIKRLHDLTNTGLEWRNLNEEYFRCYKCILWMCCVKMYTNKPKCILLGDMKNEFEELHGIRVRNTAIKCLGIYEGHDQEECYNKI